MDPLAVLPSTPADNLEFLTKMYERWQRPKDGFFTLRVAARKEGENVHLSILSRQAPGSPPMEWGTVAKDRKLMEEMERQLNDGTKLGVYAFLRSNNHSTDGRNDVFAVWRITGVRLVPEAERHDWILGNGWKKPVNKPRGQVIDNPNENPWVYQITGDKLIPFHWSGEDVDASISHSTERNPQAHQCKVMHVCDAKTTSHSHYERGGAVIFAHLARAKHVQQGGSLVRGSEVVLRRHILRGRPRLPVVSNTQPVSPPAPVISSAPAPVISSAPAPVISSAPAPVISSAPAPVISSAPAPVRLADFQGEFDRLIRGVEDIDGQLHQLVNKRDGMMDRIGVVNGHIKQLYRVLEEELEQNMPVKRVRLERSE